MTRPDRYAVWAPYAQRCVDLIVDECRYPLSQSGDGWWRLEGPVGSSTSGPLDQTAPYTYSIDGGDARPDPRGLRMAHGVHGPTTPYEPGSFAWSDAGWSGAPLDGAVIYELHVGTFTPQGTLHSAIERLGHLVELGVTIVELMPLSAFPGEHGWGYDGVAPYSVHETYGGPAGLQAFVDAAHRLGLAVCLDVVYNHLGPDGNYLGCFGPYFSAHHRTPWGDGLNLDGPGSDPVRGYVIDNACQWFEDFHLDALRLDAVHALADDRATPILEELSGAVDALSRRLGRPLWLIAEDDRNDPRTVAPRETDVSAGRLSGHGIHAQWADDIHHALHVALTGETHGYYADFTTPSDRAGQTEPLTKVMQGAFFHDGSWSSFRGRRHGRPVDRRHTPGWRFVASLQTHDQVGNRRAGERLSQLTDHGRVAAGAALLLTSPFTPMLFMGEEWAASTPWQYFTDHQDQVLAEAVRAGRAAEFGSHGWGSGEVPDPQSPVTVQRSRLSWGELDHPAHARMLAWYRELIALRHRTSALRDARLDLVQMDWDGLARVGVLHRGTWRTVVNLSDAETKVDLGQAGRIVLAWREDSTLRGAALTIGPRSACVVELDGR